MKYCSQCHQHKEVTLFSKCKATKDGLQPKCKECNKIDNRKFRIERPEHHADWQRSNLGRLLEIVSKYRKADKTPLIYRITNPDGETYIGMTQMYFSVRRMEHIANYKKAKIGQHSAPIPLLHASFDKWGVDKHTFKVLVEFPNMDRKQLGYIESSFIKSFQNINKSLNIRIK